MLIRSAPKASGQALAEFALAIPVIVVLVLGIVDLGRVAYALNAVSNAAREGTRTAIVNQTVPVIRAQAANQATALGIDASATGCTAGGPATPSTPTGTTGVCVEFRTSDLASTCAAALGCVGVITVKYTFTAITPIIGNLVGPQGLVATSKQQIESTCIDGGVPTCPTP